MNQQEYDVVAGELMALARNIETSKRPGYTRGDEDVLANFKRTGVQAGVTTEQAWAVFFLKHIDAILSIMTKPDLAVSEAAEGRFADAINYLRLGFAILQEREHEALEVRPALSRPCELPRPCYTENMSDSVTVTVPHGHGFGAVISDEHKAGQRR